MTSLVDLKFPLFKSDLLVACTRLYNPLCPAVCPTVGDTLLFLCLRAVLGLQLLPHCLAGLFHHCPCPPAHDLASCVSGLVSSLPSLYIGPSIVLHFLGFWDFWLYCSCPNDLVTSITAPAHPHATGVALYHAFFKRLQLNPAFKVVWVFGIFLKTKSLDLSRVRRLFQKKVRQTDRQTNFFQKDI